MAEFFFPRLSVAFLLATAIQLDVSRAAIRKYRYSIAKDDQACVANVQFLRIPPCGGICYKIHQKLVSYDEAKATCANDKQGKSVMFYIRRTCEHFALLIIASQLDQEFFWLGLHRVSPEDIGLRWSNGHLNMYGKLETMRHRYAYFFAGSNANLNIFGVPSNFTKLPTICRFELEPRVLG